MEERYLYEELEILKKYGTNKEIPNSIINNINQRFELRPYQVEAFKNFLINFENENRDKSKPLKNLFHMATGSGKTLVMAGLILYLYTQGYRNFLFFVNSDNIIVKTKENFLNVASSKYLFNSNIMIDGKKVKILEVDNFQNSNDEAINICFNTVQGLQSKFFYPKEGTLTLDDFQDKKIVFISDEAHHLNAMSNSRNTTSDEQTWEYMVDRLIEQNKNNILLEFTATCNLTSDYIRNKYLRRIVYNYPLINFRNDKYSKDVDTLESNSDIKTKMLQAVLLSQYRLKLFQDNNKNIKPVILLKSKTINESKDNMELFISMINNLTEEYILSIKEQTLNEILINAFAYFEEKKISINNLILELKDDFSKDKCISANDNDEASNRQIILNSLEDKSNLYRAIFAVDKLNEGWDVLNLFDIVRLYETRDSSNGRPGATTTQEAQLIGRGARYCPFSLKDDDDVYKRKFDNDVKNPMRICETLIYHCQHNPRYIYELKQALKEIGMDLDDKITKEYKLKDTFKRTDFYFNGLVFYNKREKCDKRNVVKIPDYIKEKEYEYKLYYESTRSENLFDDSINYINIDVPEIVRRMTIRDIYIINYNIVYSALRKNPKFSFNVLKEHFPNLKSMKEFITSDDYLGDLKIRIIDNNRDLNIVELNQATESVINQLGNVIYENDVEYIGTEQFDSMKFNQIFDDTIRVNLTKIPNDSVGVSQNDVTDESYRLDLSNKNWYVYNDNYGTTEEKKFVKYFNSYIDDLKEKYDEIFLIRNEKKLSIYSFNDGRKFEPDYLLVLTQIENTNIKQYQVFVEPKGKHLLLNDKWKEDFLLEIKDKSKPYIVFADDKDYFIWGLPFFNGESNVDKFKEKFEELL